MENHEENIQQEILDSMAKKVTELEKRQGKIDALELTSIPEKLKELHSTINEVKEMKIAEFGNQLMAYQKQLTTITGKIDAIPKEIPFRNRIEFDTKSKFVIKLVLSLGIATAVLLAVVVMLLFNISSRADDKNKYEIVRGFYPEIADQIDSAYIVSQDTLIEQAQVRIQHRQHFLEVANEAKKAAEESKQANDRLERLKGKKTVDKKQGK